MLGLKKNGLRLTLKQIYKSVRIKPKLYSVNFFVRYKSVRIKTKLSKVNLLIRYRIKDRLLNL